MRPPRRAALALAAAAGLAACGYSLDSGPGDDGGMPDGPPACSAFVSFEPASPIASPTTVVRANATVTGAPGVVDYAWTVTFGGAALATTPAQADGSAITFPAALPGVYAVRLEVGGVLGCPTVQAPLNVLAPGANQVLYRLRVTPPASASVPPLETIVPVSGGADFTFNAVSLDPGLIAAASVRSGGTGVAAYLRLMPVAARDAATELFTDAAGGFNARLLGQAHDVLAIPAVPGYAPRLVESWPPGSSVIDVGPGVTVTGAVRGPGGTALAGAKVQLRIGDVPSTLATTAAMTGAFSLQVEPDPGAVIAVDVTPPAGSGLPRLLAQSTTFDLGQSFQIDYAGALALRDLAGATVRRQGAPVAGAKVVVVGAVAVAGTVAAGGAPVSASGVVRVAVTANGAGVLPSALAPARALSAVIEAAPGDHAVTAIDLSSATPASIDAPPAVAIATQLRRPDGTPIAEAVLDAIPAGALALAGVTSAVRARSGAGGGLAASLAAGGRYDLRIHDPVHGRGAPVAAAGVTAPAIAASYTLGRALIGDGQVVMQGSPTPVGGASVQLLCTGCTGLARDRPVAEATTRPDGGFRLVVPDPGTN